VLRDAVLYRMLLLGEIASSLPAELRDRYPDVAWRQIRAFRNLAVHRYFGVDWAVAWKIAQDEPLVLEEQARAIMRAEFPNLAKPTSHRNQLENRQTPNHAARRRTLSATPKVRQRRRPRHSRDMAPANVLWPNRPARPARKRAGLIRAAGGLVPDRSQDRTQGWGIARP